MAHPVSSNSGRTSRVSGSTWTRRMSRRSTVSRYHLSSSGPDHFGSGQSYQLRLPEQLQRRGPSRDGTVHRCPVGPTGDDRLGRGSTGLLVAHEIARIRHGDEVFSCLHMHPVPQSIGPEIGDKTDHICGRRGRCTLRSRGTLSALEQVSGSRLQGLYSMTEAAPPRSCSNNSLCRKFVPQICFRMM